MEDFPELSTVARGVQTPSAKARVRSVKKAYHRGLSSRGLVASAGETPGSGASVAAGGSSPASSIFSYPDDAAAMVHTLSLSSPARDDVTAAHVVAESESAAPPPPAVLASASTPAPALPPAPAAPVPIAEAPAPVHAPVPVVDEIPAAEEPAGEVLIPAEAAAPVEPPAIIRVTDAIGDDAAVDAALLETVLASVLDQPSVVVLEQPEPQQEEHIQVPQPSAAEPIIEVEAAVNVEPAPAAETQALEATHAQLEAVPELDSTPPAALEPEVLPAATEAETRAVAPTVLTVAPEAATQVEATTAVPVDAPPCIAAEIRAVVPQAVESSATQVDSDAPVIADAIAPASAAASVATPAALDTTDFALFYTPAVTGDTPVVASAAAHSDEVLHPVTLAASFAAVATHESSSTTTSEADHATAPSTTATVAAATVSATVPRPVAPQAHVENETLLSAYSRLAGAPVQVDVTTRAEVLQKICDALPRGDGDTKSDGQVVADDVQLWTPSSSSAGAVRAPAPPQTALETQYARQVSLATQPAPAVVEALASVPKKSKSQVQPAAPLTTEQRAAPQPAKPVTATPAPIESFVSTAATAAVQVPAEAPPAVRLQADVVPPCSDPVAPRTAVREPAPPAAVAAVRVSPSPSFSTAITDAAGIRAVDATETATLEGSSSSSADSSLSSMLWIGAGVAVLAAAGVGAAYYLRSRK